MTTLANAENLFEFTIYDLYPQLSSNNALGVKPEMSNCKWPIDDDEDNKIVRKTPNIYFKSIYHNPV